MKCTIRNANFKDLGDIYDLVIELAIYENEPEAVTATLKDYEKNLRLKFFNQLLQNLMEKLLEHVYTI